MCNEFYIVCGYILLYLYYVCFFCYIFLYIEKWYNIVLKLEREKVIDVKKINMKLVIKGMCLLLIVWSIVKVFCTCDYIGNNEIFKKMLTKKLKYIFFL